MADLSSSDTECLPNEYMIHKTSSIVIKEKNSKSNEKKLAKSMDALTLQERNDSADNGTGKVEPEELLHGTSSNVVQLDPMPTSKTIYKSTSTPSKLDNGRNASKASPERVEITNGNSVFPRNATELYSRTKASLGTSTAIPRKFPLLPSDSREKYNRYTYLPGVKSIPSNTLEWKVPLLQKKNKMVIDDYLNTLFVEQQKKDTDRRLRDQEKIERERVEAAPEWKRPIVRQREEKRKIEQMRRLERQEKDQDEERKFSSLPPWQQELIVRRREQQRVEALPEWQKDLINKKKVSSSRKPFEHN